MFQSFATFWEEFREALQRFPQLSRQEKRKVILLASVPSVCFILFMAFSLRSVTDGTPTPLYKVTPPNTVIVPETVTLVATGTTEASVLSDEDYLKIYRDTQKIAEAFAKQDPALVTDVTIDPALISENIENLSLSFGELKNGEVNSVDFTSQKVESVNTGFLVTYELQDGSRENVSWSLVFVRDENNVWMVENVGGGSNLDTQADELSGETDEE